MIIRVALFLVFILGFTAQQAGAQSRYPAVSPWYEKQQDIIERRAPSSGWQGTRTESRNYARAQKNGMNSVRSARDNQRDAEADRQNNGRGSYYDDYQGPGYGENPDAPLDEKSALEDMYSKRVIDDVKQFGYDLFGVPDKDLQYTLRDAAQESYSIPSGRCRMISF